MAGLRRRLALAHFGVVVVVLGLAAGAAYFGLSRAVRGQLDAALLALAETESGMLAGGPGEPVRVHEAAGGGAPPSFVRLDRLVQIVDARGVPIARSANLGTARLPVHASTLAHLACGETVFETVADYAEEPIRLVTVPVRRGGTLRAVQVAGSLDDVHAMLRSVAAWFAGFGVVLLVSTGAAGAVLTRRAFGAIGDVVEKARRIDEADLAQRLPHPGVDDEIGRLVDTLNEMLGRIERSFEVQRRFTADASHELRSPLSRLRTELELALRRPRNSAAYIETIRSGLDEAERLTLLVDELLALARLDAGQEASLGPRRSLAAELDDAVSRMAPVARARGVELHARSVPMPEREVASSFGTLVIDNLLDNAIKHSPPGARVEIALEPGPAGETALRVLDRGPGIAPDDLERVFDRFHRGTGAPAGNTPGMGLGLALARAVAVAHGGRIQARARPGGGVVFEVVMPSSSMEWRNASPASCSTRR